MSKVKDRTANERQRRLRERRKQIDDKYKTLMEAQGGVQWVLSPTKGRGLHVTFILTPEAKATLMEFAANERNITYTDMLNEMVGKLFVHMLEAASSPTTSC